MQVASDHAQRFMALRMVAGGKRANRKRLINHAYVQ